MIRNRLAVASMSLICAAATAHAEGSITQVDVDAAIVGEALAMSRHAVVSADGNTVVFESLANNLHPGDMNQAFDIFAVDGDDTIPLAISKSTEGSLGDQDSLQPSVSGDGQVVAFISKSRNLALRCGTENPLNVNHVYVHFRSSGETRCITRQPSGAPSTAGGTVPVVSGNGRYVAFLSNGADLVAGVSPPGQNVFLHDLQTGTTSLASVGANGQPLTFNADEPSLSDDARYVAWRARGDNNVANADNGEEQAWVRDRTSGVTVRASEAVGGGPSNSRINQPRLSGNGRVVGFTSQASNLHASHPGGFAAWAYVRDLDSGVTHAVGRNAALDIVQVHIGQPVSLSADGLRAIYRRSDIDQLWMHDRGANTAQVVGRASNGTTAIVDNARISADGGSVVFESDSPLLVAIGDLDRAGKKDVFRHRVADQSTDRRSRIAGEGQFAFAGTDGYFTSYAAASADGRLVAFTSHAHNLVAGGTTNYSEVWLRDLSSGEIYRINENASGDPGNGDGGDGVVAISANGRYVAFTATSTNLVATPMSPASRLYVKDRDTGEVRLVSYDVNGSPFSPVRGTVAMSADGMTIVYATEQPVVFGGGNGLEQIYRVRPWALSPADDPVLISAAPGGGFANGSCLHPQIAGDGERIVFTCLATNLVANDTNGSADVFLHDPNVAGLTRVNLKPDQGQSQYGTSWGDPVAISHDGRYIAFSASAPDLTADASSRSQIYLRDTQTGTITLESRSPDGSINPDSFAGSRYVSMSADGRYLAFETARLFYDGESYGAVRLDRQTGNLIRLNRNPFGALHEARYPRISADGQSVLLAGRDLGADQRIPDPLAGSPLRLFEWRVDATPFDRHTEIDAPPVVVSSTVGQPITVNVRVTTPGPYLLTGTMMVYDNFVAKTGCGPFFIDFMGNGSCTWNATFSGRRGLTYVYLPYFPTQGSPFGIAVLPSVFADDLFGDQFGDP
jgi:Tol biopolymer transport system component